MKAEIKPPILVAIVVVVVVVVAYFGYRAISNVGSLDQGQVQYTPGKPPWLETDPNKKGPGGSPGVAQPAAATGASGQSAPITPGMPVGPPVLGNGDKK